MTILLVTLYKSLMELTDESVKYVDPTIMMFITSREQVALGSSGLNINVEISMSEEGPRQFRRLNGVLCVDG